MHCVCLWLCMLICTLKQATTRTTETSEIAELVARFGRNVPQKTTLAAAGESALAALDTDGMAEAVDALGTSDFEELGIEDGGAELRAAIEDLIVERQEQRRKLEGQRQQQQQGRPQAGPKEGRGVTGLPAMKVGAWRRTKEEEGQEEEVAGREGGKGDAINVEKGGGSSAGASKG